jgi:hypothetical protein
LNGLATGIKGFGELAKYEKSMAEINEIANRMREEQGVGAGTAYGPGSQLGQSLRDEAEIMEAARIEWAKQQQELAAAQAEAADALPPEEVAQATSGTMDSIERAAAAITPEAVANMHAFMDAITGVDTGNLDQAYKEIKELVSLNGKTITIYIEQITTTSTDGGKESGKGATSGASGSSNTYNFYNANAQDILADLRA